MTIEERKTRINQLRGLVLASEEVIVQERKKINEYNFMIQAIEESLSEPESNKLFDEYIGGTR